MESSKAGARRAGIRVLIADDHSLFRRGLREHLEASGLEVVGEAVDAPGVVALSEETHPQVILMAVPLPGGSAIDATRRLQLSAPGASVLLMTVSTEELDIVEAILVGARGCLLKDSEGDQILSGIAAAASGESALSPPVASALVERLRAHEPLPVPGTNNRPALTGRESEVLSLIVDGKDNNEIAAELVISSETVKTHVSTLLDKLEAGNRAEAAVKAVRAGLV